MNYLNTVLKLPTRRAAQTVRYEGGTTEDIVHNVVIRYYRLRWILFKKGAFTCLARTTKLEKFQTRMEPSAITIQ